MIMRGSRACVDCRRLLWLAGSRMNTWGKHPLFTCCLGGTSRCVDRCTAVSVGASVDNAGAILFWETDLSPQEGKIRLENRVIMQQHYHHNSINMSCFPFEFTATYKTYLTAYETKCQHQQVGLVYYIITNTTCPYHFAVSVNTCLRNSKCVWKMRKTKTENNLSCACFGHCSIYTSALYSKSHKMTLGMGKTSAQYPSSTCISFRCFVTTLISLLSFHFRNHAWQTKISEVVKLYSLIKMARGTGSIASYTVFQTTASKEYSPVSTL